ncbi:MAG: DUF1844 domain-containing protein [Acidobacteriaceae bacterium]|nr:DUF1844 domain-containing protein [Acidobacteriaceae bacterium]MBV9498686.1 DUF1844 domain-containing protein [Acidobacteriaceae bacterium]
MSDSADFTLPPPSFSFLVESILMQTQIQLGLLHFGGENEEQPEPNLPLARHSIDLLTVLQEKTRGNLTAEEQRTLENGITELRFRFVQVSDEVKRRSGQAKAVGEAAGKTAETPVEKKDDDRPLIITSDGGKGAKTE